ncbi:type I restriction-modification system subunit M N-terminal domain-containing protein [Clostridium perfringens]|nr:type I restriction-modification system subunit M N-terminal domain-containing protein [Clostridium perfringens]
MIDTKKEQERDELHRAIWAIADELRGAVDGWDFKNYVLGTMFYRYISENLNDVDDVMIEWHDYVVEMREQELVIIIEEERLKEDETRKFLENAFREGEVKTVGTDIDKIMPPVSRFGGGNRANKKKTVIDRLKAYFDKFYGVGGAAKFTKDE